MIDARPGLVPASAVIRYPPAGCDVLDAVGAGVGLGAAVGAFDGGAIVGDGLGAEEALPGWEFEVPALGAAWWPDRAL